MKNVIAIFLIFMLAQISNSLLAQANEFKDENGVESISQESINIFGTPANGFLDGSAGKQSMALKISNGDKQAIADFKQVCQNPSAKIQSTCRMLQDLV